MIRKTYILSEITSENLSSFIFIINLGIIRIQILIRASFYLQLKDQLLYLLIGKRIQTEQQDSKQHVGIKRVEKGILYPSQCYNIDNLMDRDYLQYIQTTSNQCSQ
ncbi:hypothetical protein FGO68_gene14784 [Halteria grandinella]|uniref:Uncharacterized protein n=1 Tax=Halteria grandinella TaxID=5974 RepID=A0A8J8N9Z9_HALGN|nr:hypothetical protein FGO68_gene14784 [Halteria grandinella]